MSVGGGAASFLFMKIFKIFPLMIVIPLLAFAAAAQTPAAAPLLPQEFAGWQAKGQIVTSTNAENADPVNAPLLKEYGFTDMGSAVYTRSDGHRLTIKAARFKDATGAYGAFTYYKLPQMLTEQIGDQGASLNARVLFYQGNILVDAVFSQLTAMSAAELRDLAGHLPRPSADAAGLPALPTYLPRANYVKNSAKYVVGPIGLSDIKAPIPARLVNFDDSAEVVTGKYSTAAGAANLMLISYPTPQIAMQQLHAIETAHNSANTAANSSQIPSGPFFDKRTGPILAFVTGPATKSEAGAILASINYDANVTWNENTYVSKRDNIGSIVVNALILSGILMLIALGLGIAFGGIRVLVKRVLPERVFDRPEQVEFISLNLTEERSEMAESKVNPSIEAS
jgi:Family of unknown function (DUF6599)